MSDVLDVGSVIEAENNRCRAINEEDWDALRAMYGDEFIHHHQTGNTDDLYGELNSIKSRPRKMTRSDLEAVVYGDVAVMTGYVKIEHPDGRPPVLGIHFMQVWVKRDGGWQLVKIHSARHPVDQ